MPKAKIIKRNRNYKRRFCPDCGKRSYRLRTAVRRLHDLGDPVLGRPRDIPYLLGVYRAARVA